MLIKTDLV